MNATTAPPPKTSPRPYKRKLLEARELRRQGGRLLYERVRLLCEVFDDREFREDLGQVDDLAAAEVLDGELSDVGFDFLQLRGVLQHFPGASQWESRPIIDMYEEVIHSRESQRESQPIRTSPRIKREEHEKVVRKLEATERRLAKALETAERAQTLEKQLADAHRRIEALEKENAELRRMYTLKQ